VARHGGDRRERDAGLDVRDAEGVVKSLRAGLRLGDAGVVNQRRYLA
jgi:hypothetical protein